MSHRGQRRERRDRGRAVRVAGVTVGVVGAEVEAVGAVGDDWQVWVGNLAFRVVEMLDDPEPAAVGLQFAVHSFGRPRVRVEDKALVIVDGEDVWRVLDLVAG